MTSSEIPTYTLKQIIEREGVSVLNSNIVVFDTANIDKLKLNYPYRTASMGIIFITNGTATINIDFQQIEAKKMDLINVFPNNILEFKQLSPDYQMNGILVSLDFLSELNLQINSQEAYDILSDNYSKIISLNHDIFPVIKYHIDKLKNLNDPNNNTFFYPEMLKLHFTLILYEMANFYRIQTSHYNFKSSRKEDIAIQYVRLIAQHFRNHKDVQYYADKIHISRKHLTRTIKEAFHKTPKQIIGDKIIAEAKILLLKKELNIRQVMAELNFEDQAAFSKYFKKHTGLTPNLYRKQTML